MHHHYTIAMALVDIYLVCFKILLFQPIVGAKSYTQTFIFRFCIFVWFLINLLTIYTLVFLYRGTLWLNHRMMAHPQCNVHRVGECGSCASSIFVGS